MSEENPEQKTIKKITQAINYKIIALIAGITLADLIYGLYFWLSYVADTKREGGILTIFSTDADIRTSSILELLEHHNHQ